MNARTDINEHFPLRGFILCDDCNKPLRALDLPVIVIDAAMLRRR